LPKSLPYFRWFPADWEMDERYAALTNEELGFLHRCLNRSWINAGLPGDLDEVARLMHTPRPELDRLWKRVGTFFELRKDRMCNRRQETERERALQTSEANARPGNANASREKRERVSNVNGTERDPNAIRSGRAYESDCVSVSGSSLNVTTEKTDSPRAQTSPRFEEFWAAWPRKTGRQPAEHVWCELVTSANEEMVFACAARYLGSTEVREGKVSYLGPHYGHPGWLREAAEDHWQGTWPVAAADPPKKESRSAQLDRIFKEDS
jgi:uncharacterized protein YdaU (DUF1376 family)